MTVPWKTVWIIGASSGIGLELARLMDAGGANVAVSARSGDVLREVAATGRSMSAHPVDIADFAAVAACATSIEKDVGPIDLAVLSAGAWSLMEADQLDMTAVRHGVMVNYMGAMHALDALIPRMLARGRGHIAIVASVAGYRGLPRSVAYGPTKAALINLAETLRTELEPRGIRVSLINPGFVDTPMTRDNPFPMPGLMSAPAAARKILSGLERGRFEIAFPFGFATAMKILRVMPDAIYFWIIRTFVTKTGSKRKRPV